MTPSARRAGCALLLLLAMSACNGAATVQDPPSATPAPVSGYVTDRTQFDAFIATQPTPDAFRRAYPDVLLVLPGDMATKELRFNNSRFFAELDADGRITGGKFK